MLRITYNDYNYANHYCVYIKLSKIIYIHNLLRRLIIYIQYFSAYQFNQI